MRPLRSVAALGEIRSLTTSVIARRGAVVALSALTQRMLVPAMARVLFSGSAATKLATGLALSIAVTAHTLIQRAFTARAESELVQRVAAAVLDGNALQSRLTSEEETRVEIVQAVYNTAEAISQTLPNLIADLIACAVLAAWIVSVESARLVGIASVLMIAAATALFFSQRSVERLVARAWHIQRKTFATFVDILEGRLEVLASGLRTAFLSELRQQTTAWGRAGATVAGSSALAGKLPLLVIALLVATVLAVSPWARHSAGATLADAALFASVAPAFAGVAQGIHGMTRQQRWIGVLVGVFRSATPVARGVRVPGDLDRHGIVFDRVSFRYEADQGDDALHEVDLAWRGKGVMALAGPNGSGKSTALRLLLALARPSAGRIVVGGEALDNVDADAWRQRVAFMPQRPYLPSRSDVGHAVRWLAPAVGDERIIHSLHRVGVLASLRRASRDPLTVKVDTLSIGERQRVVLARILCRDATLFVLDEPDANLDRAGIAIVAGILSELAREHMVIVAAHTPELLAVADCAVVLQDGRIVKEEAESAATDRRAGRR